jgi:hypothetical protein
MLVKKEDQFTHLNLEQLI